MWVCFNDGFISAVQADMKRLPKAERRHNRGTGMLCIRARNAKHLQALFPDRRVYRWPARDYPARIFIAREDFAAFMAERAGSIDYGNFKASVRDGELHDAYMAVWSVMHRYQFGSYRRAPLTTFGQLVRRAGPDLGRVRPLDDDGWAGRFPESEARRDAALLDGTCGLLGCTPENPCMDCLTEALVHENERQLGAEPDRYGDLDEEEDADAQSHLRVPPK